MASSLIRTSHLVVFTPVMSRPPSLSWLSSGGLFRLRFFLGFYGLYNIYNIALVPLGLQWVQKSAQVRGAGSTRQLSHGEPFEQRVRQCRDVEEAVLMSTTCMLSWLSTSNWYPLQPPYEIREPPLLGSSGRPPRIQVASMIGILIHMAPKRFIVS